MFKWKEIKKQLINFLQEEVRNAGLSKVTLGLSGGLDSAVVALLCKEAFGDKLNCVLMPTKFSSKSSIEDAEKLCKINNIKYEVISIQPLLDSYLNSMNNDKLRIGNFCARLRMSILYDVSARERSLVIGTSNKSELLLGYGTIYGDIACAINPLGEIYKSDEYEFGKFLGVIEEILIKAPSADLWENQSDEEDLGYTYKELDKVLKMLIDEGKSKNDLIKIGVDEKIVDTIELRIKSNAFKNKLPKIAKIVF